MTYDDKVFKDDYVRLAQLLMECANNPRRSETARNQDTYTLAKMIENVKREVKERSGV